MKDISFELMAGLSTVFFIGGFLLGILIATVITTTSFKNNKKQF